MIVTLEAIKPIRPQNRQLIDPLTITLVPLGGGLSDESVEGFLAPDLPTYDITAEADGGSDDPEDGSGVGLGDPALAYAQTEDSGDERQYPSGD
ncbi:MAG TPA: hypothetical protein VIY86_04545, partial [Pirellulaceae bacterium]